MENKSIKDRSTNFSREELEKLKELLEKHSIIYNKKTDHASAKQKDEAWSKLTEEFNSNGSFYRSKKQLIYKFNNMKKNARKELSNEKRERRLTGGGPPPPKPSDTIEWICSIMPESIVGLPSTHDSDFTQGYCEDEVDSHHQNAEVSTMEEDLTLIDIPFYIDTKQDSLIELVNQETNIKEPIQETFDTSTPKSMLKKPVSKPLETGNRKRKLMCTPLETRKKIIAMSNEKEIYIKKKFYREEKLLEFAEEEHRQNIEFRRKLNELMLKKAALEVENEVEKSKLNELMLKKAALEVEIEEEKLRQLRK